jgi:formylmethanofuran dehydrogenase subunit B
VGRPWFVISSVHPIAFSASRFDAQAGRERIFAGEEVLILQCWHVGVGVGIMECLEFFPALRVYMTSAVVGSLAKSSLTVVKDATCTRCGCLCDDINLSVQENRIVGAEHACALGERWFFDQYDADEAVCWVDGLPAALKAGIARAVEILQAGKYLLVYGLQHTTCKAQRLAVGLADRLGATIDTPTSAWMGPVGSSFQGVGEVTCTLGEVANRADFVLFWGTNPAKTLPRHFERYSLEPEGVFVPQGRAGRHVVLVDEHKTETSEVADEFISIAADKDFEALWTLRALAKGVELDAEQVLQSTGIALARWQGLMERMKKARFGAIFFDGRALQRSGGHLCADAAWGLVKDLNDHTRFVGRPMRDGGNLAGADNVLTWQTGFPFGVNLSRGYPRFGPGEFTANALLERGEVDAVLILGCDPAESLSAAGCEQLTKVPSIWIGPQSLAMPKHASTAFRTATSGVQTPGTVYRSDDVPLQMRPALASKLPSDEEILAEIQRRIEGV